MIRDEIKKIKSNKKKIKSKINRNQKNENQIWLKNQMSMDKIKKELNQIQYN
jgi:hypothetical protein